LQDLQGPKIRIGKVEEGAVLKEGEKLVITSEEIVGTAARVSTAYKSLPQDVKKGEHILIDDGKLSVMVEDVIGNEVHTRVVVGGKLLSKKGMNLPDTDISEPALTKKDKEDLIFGLENGADWIALSFVRTAGDIQNVKDIIKSLGKQARVIAKIERPEALRNIDAIIDASDAIMVARGDLGVEIATEDVPMEQKIIVRKCNLAAKPVIVATQMMESQ
jgi:pyruvate kinase